MIYLILFLFGAILGSFLNVVALRWNSGLTLGGRSMCMNCGKKLRFWELMPVVSFLAFGGRCGSCKEKISWQYPLVEIWTGLVFISIYNIQLTTYNEPYALSVVRCLLLVLIFSIYIVIAIYDVRHKIVPDSLIYPAIILSIFFAYLVGTYTIWDWLAGPLIFMFFALIWLVSRGRAMGLGDAKLGLSIGLILGAAQAFSGVALAFWIGTIVTLIYALIIKTRLSNSFIKGPKKLTMKSEVPFAPFLIIGAWLALIFNLDLFNVIAFIR